MSASRSELKAREAALRETIRAHKSERQAMQRIMQHMQQENQPPAAHRQPPPPPTAPEAHRRPPPLPEGGAELRAAMALTASMSLVNIAPARPAPRAAPQPRPASASAAQLRRQPHVRQPPPRQPPAAVAAARRPPPSARQAWGAPSRSEGDLGLDKLQRLARAAGGEHQELVEKVRQKQMNATMQQAALAEQAARAGDGGASWLDDPPWADYYAPSREWDSSHRASFQPAPQHLIVPTGRATARNSFNPANQRQAERRKRLGESTGMDAGFGGLSLAQREQDLVFASSGGVAQQMKCVALLAASTLLRPSAAALTRLLVRLLSCAGARAPTRTCSRSTRPSAPAATCARPSTAWWARPLRSTRRSGSRATSGRSGASRGEWTRGARPCAIVRARGDARRIVGGALPFSLLT